jgi:GNAT superfamily N-acetyltransferase
MSSRTKRTEVRPAVATDTPLIARLVERYWQFENIAGFKSHAVEKLLSTLLSQPQFGALWLAMVGRDPVGYAIFTFMFSLEHRGMMAEIDELFVLPEMRSHGLGAALLAASEKDLHARGFVRLQLQIDRGNRRARAFYKRHGFAGRAAYQLLDKPLTDPAD